MRFVLPLLLCLLAACATPCAAPIPHADSLVPNEAGRRHFLTARGAWEAAQEGPELSIPSLLAARCALRMAQRTDGALPLYYSQEGLVALELSRCYSRLPGAKAEAAGYLRLAEEAFQASLERHPLWVPAHEGLAELARRQRNQRDHEGHLAEARHAAACLAEAVQSWRAPLPETCFLRPTQRPPGVPLSTGEVLALLGSQIEEAARWLPQPAERVALAP